MNMKRNTYIFQIKRWLESGRSITFKQAIDEFGCTRLAAVISRLRYEYDMPITAETIPVRNRNGRHVEVAKYKLEKAS